MGEEKLARSLDGLVERGVRVLHDRRIPGGRANIDHVVVALAGFGGAFSTVDIEVLWPKKIAEHALAVQALTADQVRTIHAALAAHFPQA